MKRVGDLVFIFHADAWTPALVVACKRVEKETMLHLLIDGKRYWFPDWYTKETID